MAGAESGRGPSLGGRKKTEVDLFQNSDWLLYIGLSVHSMRMTASYRKRVSKRKARLVAGLYNK